MRRTIVALLACAALPGTLNAEPFEEAKVTETIDVVSLCNSWKSLSRRLSVTSSGQTALKTGGESRAELRFSGLT
jgi:hypothetical protein